MVPPRLNKDGYLECYIKLTTESSMLLSACEIIEERRILIYFNK
jgi:hypothetical protein